jgi:sugar lactone lactonase YvrE
VSLVGGYNHFNSLSDVFVDAQGTLWAVDLGLQQVVRITDSGTNFSFLPAPSGGWVEPIAITVSTLGVVYVSDKGNNNIVAIDSWGYGSTTIISGDLLGQPTGLWLAPNDDLYVADFDRMQILKYAAGSTNGVNFNNNLDNHRPYDVGGSPWISIWGTEQLDPNPNPGTALMNIGSDGSSSGSFGSWVDAEGLWLDC